MLSPDERRLLFQSCHEHTVATCPKCYQNYRYDQLAADLFQGRHDLCPHCRVDVSASIHEHLLSCAVATLLEAQQARAAAEAVHQEALRLRKDAKKLLDDAGVRQAEAENAQKRRRKGSADTPA
jgi:hypothetical protein